MRALLKKWWLLSNLFFLLVDSNFKAQSFQNIVPNGSFETYTQCPNSDGQIYFASPWTGPTTNSSDYMNACSNFLNVPYYGGVGSFYPYYLDAKHGSAYAGIYNYQPNNFREYLQVGLVDTLRKDQCYYVEFYATNSQNAKYCANNVAAGFSQISFTTSLNFPGSLINLPLHITNYGNPVLRDTVNWKKISGIYEADGNEKYLIIGNFEDDSNTDTIPIYPLGTEKYGYLPTDSYIFVDAVSMYSLDPHGILPWSYRDTLINEGDSVFIGNHMGGLNFHPKWYNDDGTFITTNAGITVKPEITSKYVVQFTLCGVPHSDTVKVTVNPKNGVGITKFKKWSTTLKIYPQPATDLINFENDLTNENEVFDVSIKNNLGQIVSSGHLIFRHKKATLEIEDLPAGLYLVTLKTQNNESSTKKMVVTK